MTQAGTTDPLAPLAALAGVRSAVNDSRTAIDRLREHRSQRRHGVALATESALRGAAAAAALEVGPARALSLDEVRAITTETETPTPSHWSETSPEAGRVAALGALRAYSELPMQSVAWGRSPLQALARLHVLVATGTVHDAALGRPVGAGEQRDEAAISGTRLLDLAAVLSQTRVPALVVAAVVHAEIATTRPFAWGNTIVALAAQRLVLAGRGLDPAMQGIPEEGHRVADVAYGDSLAAYSDGSVDGVIAWVRHCADAIVIGAQQGLAIGEAATRG